VSSALRPEGPRQQNSSVVRRKRDLTSGWSTQGLEPRFATAHGTLIATRVSQENLVVGVVIVACLIATGVGVAAGGPLGALTGFVVALGTGSGVAILFGSKGTDLSPVPPVRLGQKIGGLVAASACLGGAALGGWRWGWATGLTGYALGAAVAAALGLKAGRSIGNQIAASQSTGLPETRDGAVPMVPLSEFMARTAGGRPNAMNTTPYDGHAFSCACGETHHFDTSGTEVLRELAGMRLVVGCPRGDAVTCIKVQGTLRFAGFQSLFGART
jgi:hypothetical protein